MEVNKKNTPELYLMGLIKKDGKELGFRLFDLGNNELADVKANSVLKRMYKNSDTIKNLRYYAKMYDYVDNFDDFKEYVLSNIDYSFTVFEAEYEEDSYRIVLFKDDEGFITVRDDGIIEYDLLSSVAENSRKYYNVKNMYYYKGNVNYSNKDSLIDINDSIYKDKLIEIKNRAIRFKRQADLIYVSGMHKGLGFNGLGEVYIDSDGVEVFRDSSEPFKISMPPKFNKLIVNKECRWLYNVDVHLDFNKNLKIIGNEVFEDISYVTLDNSDNCFVEEICYKAFKNTELSNKLNCSWVFNKPCHFHNSSFLKATVKLDNRMLDLNIDKIDTHSFGYFRTKNIIRLHSTKESYGVIADRAFESARLLGSVILDNNLELHDKIFENCEIAILILNSSNIKVYDGCKPFKGCIIREMLISEKCDRVPDGLFDSAHIVNLKISSGKPSIGKRAFANIEITRDNNILNNEINEIDDEAFMSVDVDNYEEIKLNAVRIKNNIFRGSRIIADELILNCKDVGEGLFKDCELMISTYMIPKLFIGMFDGANIKCGVFGNVNNFTEIPDRAFKNATIKIGFVYDVLVHRLNFIGREALKGFKDLHDAYYGESMDIMANVIYESAFEDCTFYDNVSNITIECKDIRERAFKGFRVTYNREEYNENDITLCMNKVGKAAFNDLRNISCITILDKVNDKVGKIEIDDDNFKIEPDATRITYSNCDQDNMVRISKFVKF